MSVQITDEYHIDMGWINKPFYDWLESQIGIDLKNNNDNEGKTDHEWCELKSPHHNCSIKLSIELTSLAVSCWISVLQCIE